MFNLLAVATLIKSGFNYIKGPWLDYFKGKVFTTDSNYHTQVNLKECQELGLDAYRIYPQRLAIAKPVFANIRINKRLDRFTLREKVKSEYPMADVLPSTQYREDPKLWNGICVKVKVGEAQRGQKMSGDRESGEPQRSSAQNSLMG